MIIATVQPACVQDLGDALWVRLMVNCDALGERAGQLANLVSQSSLYCLSSKRKFHHSRLRDVIYEPSFLQPQAETVPCPTCQNANAVGVKM